MDRKVDVGSSHQNMTFYTMHAVGQNARSTSPSLIYFMNFYYDSIPFWVALLRPMEKFIPSLIHVEGMRSLEEPLDIAVEEFFEKSTRRLRVEFYLL